MSKRSSGSLFSMLVGSSSSQTDEDTQQYAITEDTDGEVLVEEDTDSDASDADTTEVDSSAVIPARGVGLQPAQNNWMSDYDGQLNIDMYQTKDNVVIKSTVAGVRPEDLDITVANDVVTIRGSRKREEEVAQDDLFYQECYWGGFSRSVIVPVDIDSEHIEADLRDGILTVIIPKAAKAKTRKVKVRGM